MSASVYLDDATLIDVAAVLQHLRGLPKDVRSRLVVESHPFGNIIEADTRTVHVVVPHGENIDPEMRAVRHALCYGLCKLAKMEVKK